MYTPNNRYRVYSYKYSAKKKRNQDLNVNTRYLKIAQLWHEMERITYLLRLYSGYTKPQCLPEIVSNVQRKRLISWLIVILSLLLHRIFPTANHGLVHARIRRRRALFHYLPIPRHPAGRTRYFKRSSRLFD